MQDFIDCVRLAEQINFDHAFISVYVDGIEHRVTKHGVYLPKMLDDQYNLIERFLKMEDMERMLDEYEQSS